MQLTHFNIKPINCFIKERYLYDMNLSKIDLLPCKIISVSSYKGHIVTFNVIVDGKYLFSYMPANAFACDADYKDFSIEQSSYHNCPSNEVSISYFDLKDCFAYNKSKEFIGKGIYQFTIDWYNENEMLHFIMIDGGFIFVPNHKMSFEKIEELPRFSKLKKEFKI